MDALPIISETVQKTNDLHQLVALAIIVAVVGVCFIAWVYMKVRFDAEAKRDVVNKEVANINAVLSTHDKQIDDTCRDIRDFSTKFDEHRSHHDRKDREIDRRLEKIETDMVRREEFKSLQKDVAQNTKITTETHVLLKHLVNASIGDGELKKIL